MSGHESFEELCALAVTGDLEPEEFRRLGEHLYECPSCRVAYRDFHALVEHGGSTLRPERSAHWSVPIFRAKRRFIARARREGVPMELPTFRPFRSWRTLAPAAVVSLTILAGFEWQWNRFVPDRTKDSIDQIALLTSKVAELERRLSEKREAAAVPVPTQPPVLEPEPRPDNELSRLRSDYEVALAAKTQLGENVSVLSAQLGQLRGESDTARAEAERLQRDLLNTQTRLAQTNQELGSLRLARSADATTIAEQRVRLDELTGTIREQTAVIQRERELLAAGKDVRDLMGARNLRIVDVRDEGTPGKQRPLAGRIFYTQAKSLYFYAYDLDNKGNVGKVAFQAWGKREGRSQPPRSLGIFYVDDSTQHRWVLKFEDPAILAQIDQVFVTVEPLGGSPRPTGKQLLAAAFLNEEANHP